jgi:surface polysaccharide O-acyltransferase-like enzyme
MSKFLQYIHNLRGLAILFVVAVHARAMSPEWFSHPAVNEFFDLFLDPSEGNGTVLFLFIGGFLFQHIASRNFSYKKFIEQKFKVIILPYILISIPLIIIRVNTNFDSLSLPEGFHERSLPAQFFHYMLTGAHMPPFWFISTIVLFYLTAPLLHVCDNKWFYKWIFPFVILVCLFTYRPEHNANPLLSYVHYLPIYFLGMFASYYKDKILSFSTTLLYISAIAYFTICALDLLGYITLSREITFEMVVRDGLVMFNIYIFKAMILCLMLMLLLYRFRDRQLPLLELLGDYSFGIFFVHYIFISISRKLLQSMGINILFSLPAYLIYFLFILVASVITVYLVKKLAGRKSRYLIGS